MGENAWGFKGLPGPNRAQVVHWQNHHSGINHSRGFHIKVRSAFIFVLRRIGITVGVHYQSHT